MESLVNSDYIDEVKHLFPNSNDSNVSQNSPVDSNDSLFSPVPNIANSNDSPDSAAAIDSTS